MPRDCFQECFMFTISKAILMQEAVNSGLHPAGSAI